MAVSNMKLVTFMTVVLFQTGITLTGLHVVIQKHNVTAPYQEEVSLYCNFFFENIAPLESIHLNWWKNESGERITICAPDDGHTQKDGKYLDHRNRIEFTCDVDNSGSTLILKNLTLQDAGQYICEVWTGGYSLHGQDSVNLSVAAKPSVLDFVSKESNSLSFNSYGWFPKPHIFWTDKNNMSMIANTNISQGKDGLYSIQTVLHPDTNPKTYKLHLMFISPHSGKNQTEVFMQKAAVADSCQGITTTGSIILGVFVGFGIIVAVAVHKCWGQNSKGGLSLLARLRSTHYGSVDGGRCRPQN